VSRSYLVHEVTSTDKHLVTELTRYDSYVHHHLDWRTPLEWFGFTPYLLLESNNSIANSPNSFKRGVATLACPRVSFEATWIRIFAYLPTLIHQQEAWNHLWEPTLTALRSQSQTTTVAAVPFHNWFRELLASNGFECTHDVVSLVRNGYAPLPPKSQTHVTIREMTQEDIPFVQGVDAVAFPPLWHYSLETLRRAFLNAHEATVAMLNDTILGYQISTATAGAGHLARLAVLPQEQRNGIGSALLQNLLERFAAQRFHTVSVNTQNYNQKSISLYEKFGFVRTEEIYPVFEFPVN